MDNKNRPAMENATGFHKLRHIASLPLEAVLLPEPMGVIILYDTTPNKALFYKGIPVKISICIYIYALFDPPKMGNLMIPEPTKVCVCVCFLFWGAVRSGGVPWERVPGVIFFSTTGQ